MFDLFNRYNIAYKFYKPDSDDWQTPIDYKYIDPIIENDINESMLYLKKSIG